MVQLHAGQVVRVSLYEVRVEVADSAARLPSGQGEPLQRP
jgi:hypothetical protein